MRQALVLLHRYLGLTLAAFLFVAGLTGAVLAFQQEVDATLNPDLHRATTRGRMLSLSALENSVERQLPAARVSAVQPAWRPGASAVLRVEPRSTGARLSYDEVFADPVSGVVLGQRQWGAAKADRQHLVPFLYKLHYTLHLPAEWGLWLMGGAALLWTLDCLIALALSAPRGSRKLEGWRRALTVKPQAASLRRTLDLHRAPGLWLWIVLLAIAITGVGLNLRDQIFVPLISSFSPVAPAFHQRPAPSRTGPDRLTFDEAATAALDAASADGRPGRVVYVLRAESLHAIGVAIAQRAGDPRIGLGPDWYYFDTRDGGLRAAEPTNTGSVGDTIVRARYPIHTGLIFGRAGQILICLTGLATAALSVTGVLLWAGKRRARSLAEQRAMKQFAEAGRF